MTEPVIIDLGYKPRKWQEQCHRSRKRFTVLALHRRAGKTELAVMQLMDEALRCTLPLPLFVYLAPFLKQAKAIAWERIKAYARCIPNIEINESELWVRMPHNGARIQLFGGDNPDGMRGLRLDGAVIDEVAQIKPEVWNEIIQPALSDRKGWALFIGTPKGINLFSELFYKAERLPDWYSARYTVYDTDALDPDEVERLRRDMPENEFAREYLCDFAASAEDQLISIGMAEEAARRTLRTEQYDFAAKVIGVDPARFGDDKSVIYPRQGLVAFKPKVFAGINNMQLADAVASAIHNFKPDAVFIDAGNGAGVIDRLRQLGHAVIEVNFGGKAIDPRFINKRTEMWWRMKEWIEQGGVIPNSPELKQDLASPTYHYNSANKLCLESKDDIKARIMRSPDQADALALTFAFPVAPSLKHIHPSFEQRGVLTEYDPFEAA
jgi:hypothetical protein